MVLHDEAAFTGEPSSSRMSHLGAFLEVRPHVIKEMWKIFEEQYLVEPLISAANTTKAHRGQHEQTVKQFALYCIQIALPDETPNNRARIDRFKSAIKSGNYSSPHELHKFFELACAEFANEYST